jgi:hypothetical protein
MNHLDFEKLTAWWLGDPADAEQVEEHLFACARCAAQLEWLAALSEGLRAAVRAGAFGMAVSAPFVEAMKRAGMRLREYRADAGATVSCTMRADEDAVVSRLRAPLAGAQRLDVLQRLELGGVQHPEVRLAEVPFDPASGELLILQPSAQLKKMPKHTMRVRLVAVEEKGERVVGEYTFAHTPG